MSEDELEDRTGSYQPFAAMSKTLLARAKGTRKKRGTAANLGGGGDGKPHAVDIFVGGQLKKLRGRRGLSQQALANKLGLTFQQVQKYEGGKNRLSASRLFEISSHLGVEPAYFFEGIDPRIESRINGVAEDVNKPYVPEEDIMAKTESIRLMRAYFSIDDPNVRLALKNLIKRVAKAGGHVDEDDNAGEEADQE